MDDLALFSPTHRHAQAQLNCLSTFLAAYGMALNTAKCRHTIAHADGGDAQDLQQQALTVHTTAPDGSPATSAIPITDPSATFAYLGHHINPRGDWAVQEGLLTSKLGAAVQQVKLAAGNKACHTLWTAAFTESDAMSVLPYYMAATGLSQNFLDKARTQLAEPCRARAFIGKHVSRQALFGGPALKGLGLTSPQAAEAGIKVSTLIRLLNDTSQPAPSELAADPLRALRTHKLEPADPQPAPIGARRRGRPPGPTLKHVPALQRTAVSALATHSRAEHPLALLENYKDLGSMQLALLCPLLGTTGLPKALPPLARLTAAAALRVASTPAGHTLSEAERAILAGRPSQAFATLQTHLSDLHARAASATASATDIEHVLRTLLTDTAMQQLSKPRHPALKHKVALAVSLTSTLLAELCGPDAYMFVTRHSDAYLRTMYPPPTALAPHLYSPQVGVDGSMREAAHGRPAKGAGAAAFLTATRDPDDNTPTLTAHIVTSTYQGEQSVANSEYAGLTIALQTLCHSPLLQLGCDHLNAVRLLHTSLPATVPAPGSSLAATPTGSVGNGSRADADPHTHLQSAEHYAGNPHMALAHALVTRDITTHGHVRTVYKVAAHASQASDAAIAELLDDARGRGAGAVWNNSAKEYTIDHQTIQAIFRIAEDALKAATADRRQDARGAGSSAAAPAAIPPEHVRSTALNALADWGAKQVALRDAPPSVAQPPTTLSAGKWCLASRVAGGAHGVQQSDPTTARKLVTRRVEHANLESTLHPDSATPPPTRLNFTNLWTEESSAVLKRPRYSAAAGRHATMPDEKLTKHYCHMAYGSTLYNADALLIPKNRALASTCVKDPAGRLIPFSTHCQLCLPIHTAAGRPPAEDTRHHLFHICPAPAVATAREALRVELTAKIREVSNDTMDLQSAAQTADLIMHRDDYYAGQIDIGARDRIAAAMQNGSTAASEAPAGRGPATTGGRGLTPAPGGSLQLTVLKHSLRIHNIRQEAIPEHLRLLQYRLAMWADERKEASKRRYAKEQARAAAAGAGNGSANLGAPAGPAPGSGGATLLPPEPQPRPADPADPVLEHDDGPEDDENQ
jgi:hypothetical protein